MQSADSSRAGPAGDDDSGNSDRTVKEHPMNTTRTPVVFIHSLWLHASSWDPWVQCLRVAAA